MIASESRITPQALKQAPKVEEYAGLAQIASTADEADSDTGLQGRPLRVLTFTSLFPNAQQSLHGLFVRERVRALARFCDLRVMAPVPWAPPLRWLGERYYRYSQVARQESQDSLTVKHPRFVVIPKVLKAIDGLLMATEMAPDIIAQFQGARDKLAAIADDKRDPTPEEWDEINDEIDAASTEIQDIRDRTNAGQ